MDSGKLTGWGSWAGPDIKQKEIDPEVLKRKRFEKIVRHIYCYTEIERRKAKKEGWHNG